MFYYNKSLYLGFLQAKSLLSEKGGSLIFAISFAIMMLSFSASGINIGFQYKFFEDTLLVSQGFLFVVSSLFYSLILLKKDKDLKLFMLPIGMGMTRKEYLMSFFFSMIFIQFFIFFIFFVLDFATILIVEKNIYIPLFYQLFLFFLQSVLIAFISILFSEYVSIFNSVIYAILIFIIGNALDEVYYFFAYLKFLYFLFPNFYFFDFIAPITNRAKIDTFSFYIFPIFYTLIWSMIFYFFALIKYNIKDLNANN